MVHEKDYDGDYKKEFIRFLVEAGSLTFGKFRLKSGRVAPYFINTGMFNDGKKIAKLGEFYAKALLEHFGENFDAIYGPAYKGIPISVSTAIALSRQGITKGYVFNRKKLKDYGMKDNLVGMSIDSGSRLILVDDVITSGAAIRESLDVLKQFADAKVSGIIISINRQEKGTGEKNALKEVEGGLGIPIFAIVTLQDVIGTLYNKEVDGKVYIDDDMMTKIRKYRLEYGTEL